MFTFYFQIFIIGFVLALSNASYAQKKQCQPYLDKLRNIQSQQRQSYSLKRGESLNKREAKARAKWWQCERGILKVNKNKNKNKKKISHMKRKNFSGYSSPSIPKKNLNTFQVSGAVVIKSRYEGKQLAAWLEYYQQPQKCSRPKTTKQFAFCVEDRNKQQLAFEKVDATASIQ